MNSDTSTTPSNTHLAREATRSLLTAVLAAVLITVGATCWVRITIGAAGIDHMMIPTVCFPLVWLACALGLYAAPNQRRARLVVGGLTALGLLAILIEAGS